MFHLISEWNFSFNRCSMPRTSLRVQPFIMTWENSLCAQWWWKFTLSAFWGIECHEAMSRLFFYFCNKSDLKILLLTEVFFNHWITGCWQSFLQTVIIALVIKFKKIQMIVPRYLKLSPPSCNSWSNIVSSTYTKEAITIISLRFTFIFVSK